MSIQHLWKKSVEHFMHHNRDGSFGTQRSRRARLRQLGSDLIQAGYKITRLQSLKPKHVSCLVGLWKARNYKASTMKNFMTDLRWVAGKINKSSMIPKRNTDLGIPNRVYLKNVDKSTVLTEDQLMKPCSEEVRLSLRFQILFGLRREEAMKIQPILADKKTYLNLKGSWCKSGRPRQVPILTEEQRALLEEAEYFVFRPKKSLIPSHRTYRQHLRLYESQIKRASIRHVHGLRHAYAHRRYEEMTGWPCPAKGGPLQKELTEEQKLIDLEARQELSEELGHERLSILETYIGR